MPHKSLEDMDFFEILGLRREASPEDIVAAYRKALSTYEPRSLASYGLVSEDERRLMLDRIERAFRTLMDPGQRNAYDRENLPEGRPSLPGASFRKSVDRMEIQDADRKMGFLEKIHRLLKPNKARNIS